ncbi:MAG: DUF262 domain-containing protein [Chloroflexi bacterium]|nr:DUF262 domain-containing protein [Chloroflexota bacterium]
MEVYTRNIGHVFLNGGNIHYAMPHFQRPYAWDEQNWQALLNDVFDVYAASRDGTIHEHFMGALVVVNEGTYRMIQTYKLVDGQQRLTTISLLLRAFLDLTMDFEPDLSHEIESLLVNRRQESSFRYKLLPTLKRDDRRVYQAVIDGLPTGETESLIDDAVATIRDELQKRIQAIGDQFDLERMYNVITAGLYVVFIEIKQNERPYEIFESLNAKGKALTQTDLVRNYIAMRLPLNDQERMFDQHWSFIDNLLDDERTVARIGEMTAFLRHYLAMRTGQLFNEDAIYQRFRERMEREFKHIDDFVGELSTLRAFAEIYDRLLRPEREPNPALRRALERLNLFESSTAYPVLLYLFDAYQSNQISESDLLGGLDVLENYLVRRALVGETTYANRMFPALIREIDLDELTENLRKLLARRRYIPDTRLRETIMTRRLYSLSSRDRIRFLLEEVNRRLSEGTGGYTVLEGNATIEHIMPQTLSTAWREALGPDAERIQAAYVHTLGNLTLVNQSWNSSLSNSGFTDKLQKLRQNALRLNQVYFGSHGNQWSEDAIRARAEWLIEKILGLWPSFVDTIASTETESFKYTSPTALLVNSESIDVSSWRDVTRFMARLAWDKRGNFERLANLTTNVARYVEGKYWFHLDEGWAVYVNLDANSHMSLCRELGNAAGLNEGVDWWVEFERY